MNTKILELLRVHNEKRNWEEIENTFHPVPARYFKGFPVYEFFHTLDDNLDIDLTPIALSVNPVESFVPYHYHNYVEIIIPLEGEVTILTASEEIKIKEKDIFIAGPNTIHQNKPIGKEDVVLNISLKPTAFSLSDLSFLKRQGASSYLADILFFSPDRKGENTYLIFKTNPVDDIIPHIHHIILEYFGTRDFHSNHIIRCELLVLFAKLLRLSNREAGNVLSSNKEELLSISLLHYIETCYATVTLEEMGKRFGFNANYLSSYLKKHTGQSFIKLVHEQRVNIAAEYLIYTNAPIEKISLKVGYENPSYFYKVFKKILGVSPAEYRKNNK